MSRARLLLVVLVPAVGCNAIVGVHDLDDGGPADVSDAASPGIDVTHKPSPTDDGQGEPIADATTETGADSTSVVTTETGADTTSVDRGEPVEQADVEAGPATDVAGQDAGTGGQDAAEGSDGAADVSDGGSTLDAAPDGVGDDAEGTDDAG